MTKAEEQIYERGSCAPPAQRSPWDFEREATVAMLRAVCAEYGDNDWPDNLHLADVIEKHLWRNLWTERQK